MKPFNGAEFSTIIYINYGIASLASCVSIENKHAPLLVYIDNGWKFSAVEGFHSFMGKIKLD